MKATSTTAASDGVAETHVFGEHTGESREIRWTLIWERPGGIADPRASRVFGQSSQPHPPWSRCSRQPLRVLKAEKAQHISIPAPLRNANSREISSSASRSVLGRREPQLSSSLQTLSTFVCSQAYCSQKPELPVMHQMCKKSSRSSCYHRQPHLQQQRLVL